MSPDSRSDTSVHAPHTVGTRGSDPDSGRHRRFDEGRGKVLKHVPSWVVRLSTTGVPRGGYPWVGQTSRPGLWR